MAEGDEKLLEEAIKLISVSGGLTFDELYMGIRNITKMYTRTMNYFRTCDLTRILNTGVSEGRIEFDGETYQLMEPTRKKSKVVIETPSPSPNEPVDRSTLDIGPGVSSEIETNEGEMVTQMPVVQTSDNRIVEEVVIETPSPSPNEPVDRSTLDIGPGVSSEIETNEGEMVTQMPVVQTSDNRIVEEVVIETPSPSPNEPVDRSTLDIGPGVSSEIETNEGEMVTQMPVVQTSDNRIVEEVVIETPSPSPNEPVDRSTLDIGPGVSSEIETNEGEMVTQMPVVQTSDNRIVEEVVIETPSPSPNEPVDRSTLDIGPGVSSEIETNEGEMVTQMPVVQTSDNRIVEEVVIETPSPSPNEPVDRSTLDIGPGVSSEIETNEGEMVTQMPVVQTSDNRIVEEVVIETPSPSPNEPVDRSTLDIGPGVSSEIETNEGEMVTQMPVVQTSDNRIVEEVVIETPSPSPNEPVDRSTLDIGPGVSSEIETNEGEMVTQMPVVQTSDNRIVEEVVIETPSPSPSPNEPVDRSTLDIGPGVSSEIETNEGEMVTQMPVVQTSDNRIVEEVVIETPSLSPNEPVDRSTLDIGPGVSSEIETNEGEMVTQMPVVQTSDNRIVEEVVIETPSPSPNEPVDRSTLDIGPGVSSEIETNEGEMVTQMPVVQTSDNRIVEEVVIETPSPSPNEPVDRSTLDIGPGVSSEIETNEGEMVTQMPVVQTSDNRIVEEEK